MRAIVVNEAGGPEVLQVQDIEAPVPGPGQVLAETAAVGVNFIEIYQRSGTYNVTFPFIPGTEAAGTVIAVGVGVTDFQPGDRVATNGTTAAYADQFVTDAGHLARVPDSLDFELAAAVPLQGCTAHYLANSAANPQPGDAVLVHAGAGGVGLLLTQLLSARGVRVFTTASTAAKKQLSLEAGAEAALDYEGFADRVRELTGGEGVAVAYDSVGIDTFDDSLSTLRLRGEMVLFGASSGPVPPLDLFRLNHGGSLRISRPSLPHFMHTPEERRWRYRELFDAIEAGTLKLRIGGRFALADAADAHRALAGRGTTGKLIMLP